MIAKIDSIEEYNSSTKGKEGKNDESKSERSKKELNKATIEVNNSK